jgi:hypothetical protein
MITKTLALKRFDGRMGLRRLLRCSNPTITRLPEKLPPAIEALLIVEGVRRGLIVVAGNRFKWAKRTPAASA